MKIWTTRLSLLIFLFANTETALCQYEHSSKLIHFEDWLAHHLRPLGPEIGNRGVSIVHDLHQDGSITYNVTIFIKADNEKHIVELTVIEADYHYQITALSGHYLKSNFLLKFLWCLINPDNKRGRHYSEDLSILYSRIFPEIGETTTFQDSRSSSNGELSCVWIAPSNHTPFGTFGSGGVLNRRDCDWSL